MNWVFLLFFSYEQIYQIRVFHLEKLTERDLLVGAQRARVQSFTCFTQAHKKVLGKWKTCLYAYRNIVQRRVTSSTVLAIKFAFIAISPRICTSVRARSGEHGKREMFHTAFLPAHSVATMQTTGVFKRGKVIKRIHSSHRDVVLASG